MQGRDLIARTQEEYDFYIMMDGIMQEYSKQQKKAIKYFAIGIIIYILITLLTK